MDRRALFAIWTLATLAAMAVAWGVVSAAGAQVADRPLVPLVVATNSPTTAATPDTAASSSTTTTSPGSTTTSSPSTTPTTGGVATTTTAPSSPKTERRTVSLQGGTVSFTVLVGQVLFEAAVPAPAYVVQIEAVGPEEVRVRFESSDHTSELRAEWDDGELDIEVREEGE